MNLDLANIILTIIAGVASGAITAGSLVFAIGRRDGLVVEQLKHLNTALLGVSQSIDKINEKQGKLEVHVGQHAVRLDSHEGDLARLKEASGGHDAQRFRRK